MSGVVGVFVFYGCPLVGDCCAVFAGVLFLSWGGAALGLGVGEGAVYLWGGELCELCGVVDDEFLYGGGCGCFVHFCGFGEEGVLCLECGGVVFCGVGVEGSYGEWGDVGVEVLGELVCAVVFEVVAGVVTFGEWYCPGLCLDFGCGVPGGSGGFLSGVIAVEDVYDCACFSGEAL